MRAGRAFELPPGYAFRSIGRVYSRRITALLNTEFPPRNYMAELKPKKNPPVISRRALFLCGN